MWTIYAAEAGIGLGGAVVYGFMRLTSALCGGDQAPDELARRRAWAEFANTLIAGPLFAGVLTTWVSGMTKTPWPPTALTIGLLATLMSKDLPGLVWPRLKTAWEALTQAPTQGSKP